MQKKVASVAVRINLFGLLVLLFVAIRYFEHDLFYDPFYPFFKGEVAQDKLPTFAMLNLLVSLCMRYWLNTLVSLAITYVVFERWALVKFTECSMDFFSFSSLLSFSYSFITTLPKRLWHFFM